MTRSSLPTFAALVAVLVAPLLAAVPAQAQNTGKTSALGGGAGTGPVMSREELRACIKNREDIAARSAKLDAARKALNDDKAAILAETEALKGDRGNINTTRGDAEAFNQAQQKINDRFKDLMQRIKTFDEEGRTGPIADTMRRNLMREKAALERENEALQAQRGNVKPDTSSAQAFNARVTASEQKVVAWNERNAAAAKESEDLLQERDLWAAECAGRRYREDDEIAIKKGN